MLETIDNNFAKKILRDRGFTKGEIEDFLNPVYIEDKAGLYDAKKMKDIDKAISRVWEAVDNNEKICIYSDYDADGVPGAVILHQFFKKIGFEENVIVKIPHRHRDGFGLHKHLIDEVKKEGVSLLITIDLGISNVKEVDHANDLGIDVIITDHHQPHEELPRAYAILNSKQDDCNYPEKNLCGAGVIFKLIHLLIEGAKSRGYKITQGFEKWLLDMAGLATISDMVPLIGENRILAFYGLKVLQKNRRPGLYHLLKKMKIDERYLDEGDIGFSISPCINAASRMNHADDAFMLLSSDDENETVKLADQLIGLNKLRKDSANELINDIKNKIDSSKIGDIIVIGDENWSPTILGPAASQLVRQFQVPVFIYAADGGEMFRGSCRSVKDISLTEIMHHVSPGFFTEFGGHHASGGFAFIKEKKDLFENEIKNAFQKYKSQRQHIVEEDEALEKIYNISHEHITTIVSHLKQMKPFGMNNPNPLFCIRNVSLSEIRYFGKQKEHIEFLLKDYMKEDGSIENVTPELFRDVYKYSEKFSKKDIVRYISFFAENHLQDVSKDVRHDIYGRIEESYFLGKREIRVKVEYINVSK